MGIKLFPQHRSFSPLSLCRTWLNFFHFSRSAGNDQIPVALCSIFGSQTYAGKYCVNSVTMVCLSESMETSVPKGTTQSNRTRDLVSPGMIRRSWMFSSMPSVPETSFRNAFIFGIRSSLITGSQCRTI